MKAALLAAGQGSRLQDAGPPAPKPLLRVGGRALIDWTLGSLRHAGATQVVCILNEDSPAVRRHLQEAPPPIPVRIVEKTTAHSFESLLVLSEYLRGEPFLLSTVDTLAPPARWRWFAQEAQKVRDACGVLALSDFIDDEKPLRASLAENGRIEALGEEAASSRYVTAGFYYFTPRIERPLEEARRLGLGALREFLALLLNAPGGLRGLPVGKTVDVDRPRDVEAAESFVSEWAAP